MQLPFAPIARLSALVAASLVLAAIALGFAMDNRWLGLRLVADSNLAIAPAVYDGVWIDAVAPDGPARTLTRFEALVAITGMDGATIPLEARDLIEEPDALASYAEMNAFFARQSAIAAIQERPLLDLETRWASGEWRSAQIVTESQRPVADLPFAFWLQIGVGLAGFRIGAWIWSVRRRDWAARMLALAGTGLMISAFPAAVYSTRELAIDGALFAILSHVNHAGALIFGIGMIGLFLVYPRKLVPTPWLALPAAILAAWYVVDVMQWAEGPGLGFHLAVVLAMAAILVLVGVQYAVTGGDPRARAALAWLGLAVIVGAGLFVATVIAPNLLGVGPLISQGIAFVFFLVIYVGVALGVARYKLFQLDEWAFRILFYVVGVILLLVLDAILILTIVEDHAPAFAMSLLIVAVLYLPLRDVVARWVLRRREPQREALFRQVMDVALTPPGKDQRARWQALLERCFRPLSIEATADAAEAVLVDDGMALAVPGPKPLPGFRLEHADGGRRLFSPHDAHLAAELHAMLENALESRDAYEKGVAEERQRIARDIHDNIGVQLMGALHSKGAVRKDQMIRETLTDLRDIVNNASRPDLSFEETMADLRLQISEHLFAAGIEMDWQADADGQPALPIQTAHALRSVVREAVQNILKHAGAGTVTIRIRHHEGSLSIRVSDDGKGFDPAGAAPGNGLSNMQARVAGLGGRFALESGPHGTVVDARFPMETGGTAQCSRY